MLLLFIGCVLGHDSGERDCGETACPDEASVAVNHTFTDEAYSMTVTDLYGESQCSGQGAPMDCDGDWSFDGSVLRSGRGAPSNLRLKVVRGEETLFDDVVLLEIDEIGTPPCVKCAKASGSVSF